MVTKTGHVTVHLAEDNVLCAEIQKPGEQCQVLQERGSWWLGPLNKFRAL